MATFFSTSKMLGDAGEHYALSQFTFCGKPCTKMPDNWTGYDLAVETGSGLARVSVKTRSETINWKKGNWFNFDDTKDCDWFVFVFRTSSGLIRAWVMPFAVALENANTPGVSRKDAWNRDIAWWKLNEQPLLSYENNWAMQDFRVI